MLSQQKPVITKKYDDGIVGLAACFDGSLDLGYLIIEKRDIGAIPQLSLLVFFFALDGMWS